MEMQTTFRRLAVEDANRFAPWYTIPSIKIFGIVILLTVCLRWIVS